MKYFIMLGTLFAFLGLIASVYIIVTAQNSFWLVLGIALLIVNGLNLSRNISDIKGI